MESLKQERGKREKLYEERKAEGEGRLGRKRGANFS